MGKSKLLTGVVLLLLGFFVFYQLYSAFYNPISIEIVNQFSSTDGIDITGIIIREEQLISGNSSAALHFEVENGQRVSKNGVIADIYDDVSQSVAATRAADIEKEIKSIEEIEKYNDLNAVDINLINSKFYSYFDEFSAQTATGKFTDIEHQKNEMLGLINRKQLATGIQIDFSAQIAALKNQLAVEKTKAATPRGSIRAAQSGYFVSSADGYEGVLNPNMIGDITPEFLESLTPTAVDTANVIGKLVSNYTWYIAAGVSVSDSMQFKVGDNLKIKSEIKSGEYISVQVHSINISPNSSGAVIVFSCREMSGELSSVRSAPMRVVRNEYSGLKVSSKALRVINETQTDQNGVTTTKSVTGVYVLSGMTAHFVPVNIIYSPQNGGYVLCDYNTEDGNLKLYDEIIVKGKNIYDGKIID